ncbi:MAG: acyl-CoA dehydrogenase family protein [Cyanobacteria bacterium SZAS LIN-2]|nr:acyl-CoA dehydrogenase family protein [Cyanobacteria bacterium SZAS LIN-3]MBS1997995.1 acyl-CoA dehydrogenase family protein [Cyanobacteria bacterium SZAS LIN-2]MBS2009793.1 acyl-CoA dehydrogenase family protein [Cyanobacteria bacterium SZAS TMP-1]
MVQTQITPGASGVMSGKFSKEQLAWLDKAKSFAAAVPLSEVMASDKDNTFRRDLFVKACQEGFGALPFGPEYKTGLKDHARTGGDYVSFALINQEFARKVNPIMSSLGVHVLCQEPIYKFGNAEQKAKYLPPSATGEFLGAFGLTEPNAGSDTAAIETTARLVGDEYILNGTKTFITSGASADFYIVMARLLENKEDKKSDGEANPHKAASPAARSGQITAFVVERKFEGFEIGQKFDMLGMRGYSTCEIVMNDCKVPKANLLGAHGEGRKVALGSLAKGRVTIAAQCCGWAQGAFEAATNLLQRYYRDGAINSDANGHARTLGEMAVSIESARVLTFQAARLIDANEASITVAAMAKTVASDTAMKVATDAISLLGLEGLKPDLLIERIFRDAKAGQIYEGTNQIQRMLIARDLLKS